ncbi:MAG: BLUF domain-containing protein [Proteobacteria bacterium]|nr:BLUF domain-containing protein [Pseudomonadota bacterium]
MSSLYQMPSLYNLIYVSQARHGLGETHLGGILDISRARNSRLGISGLLLYAGGRFIQVLEGGREAVEAVYASIEKDIRHDGVTALVREPIAARSFPDWSMGFERCAQPGPGVAAVTGSFEADPAALRGKLRAATAEVKGLMLNFVDVASQRRAASRLFSAP